MFFGIGKDDSGTSRLVASEEGIVRLPEEISWEPYPGGSVYEEDYLDSKRKKRRYEESPHSRKEK